MDDDRDHGSSSSEGRKRPYKVWDSRRYTKKGIVASSLEELLNRGREKLRYDVESMVSAVLESDGTTVDDAEYFATLPDNTVFLLLRDSDRWLPPGVDVLRAALTCIPRIVCQTMHALDLRDEAPSWKIADHRGQVTIQLHWDADRRQAVGSPGRRAHIVVRGVGEAPFDQRKATSPVAAPFAAARSRLEEPPPPYAVPPGAGRLSRQGSSVESGSVHVHTAECGPHHHPHHHHHHHQYQHQLHVQPRSSPPDECDFHCCALHAGRGAISVKKSTATSPIREPPPPPPARRPLSHVRFDEAAKKDNGPAPGPSGAAAAPEESSESEGDNTANEEGVTEKLLLLVDQLSVERMRYLSIKDIGIILERLSSKILDVERMEREKDGDDCHNWTLKATIRGDVLRDIGVVYHGHYYSIGEHPRYERRVEPPPPAEPPPP
ncbi:uncharacterized protein LOC119097399 [Pollicipes pollicipes]|uniref:uncharacterized protein LOC119097399 n=1 Tax=Pollicipes pollicipes TaxID=41117 RepID=UPI00188593F2|nr:uncharacterized protein LOC119097399 [Pollicipes pollicipes]